MKYFFDTYAIIEIIRESEAYKPYLDEEMTTSLLNVGELYYSLIRECDKKTADYWATKLECCCLDFDVQVIMEAMDFRFKSKPKKFSFIDCIGYVMAKRNELVFLTGDKEFEDMPNVEYIK